METIDELILNDLQQKGELVYLKTSKQVSFKDETFKLFFINRVERIVTPYVIGNEEYCIQTGTGYNKNGKAQVYDNRVY